MTEQECLVIPAGLSEKGRKAAEAILALGRKYSFSTGGCPLFYSSQQWRDRGEKYGTTSELIVVYDGGDFRHLFEAVDHPELVDDCDAALAALGLMYEPCTCWYSAIYNNE